MNSVRKVQDTLYPKLSNKKVMVAYTILPALLLFAFINIVPILWAIVGGFFQIHPFTADWTWLGMENYRSLVTDSGFHHSLYLAVIYAVGTTVLQLAAGIGIALIIVQEFKFKKFVRAIVFLPYLVPHAIVGYLIIWMSNTNFGVVNQVLIQIGLIDHGIVWFDDASWAMFSTIIASSWKLTLFITIMVVARLMTIPNEYYEVADLMGASTWRKFRDITLPNLVGVIFIVLLLRFIWMFNRFDIVWILTRGGPGDATTTAPIYLFESAFVHLDIGYAAAGSTLLFGMLVVFALIYFVVFEPEDEVRVE